MHVRATFTVTVAALMSFTAAFAAPPSDPDRRQLEELAHDADSVWDRGDAAALAGLYTDDATLVMAPRERVDGRDAIRAYFEQSFVKRPPHLRHVTAVQRIEMLAPDVAFVDTDVRLERRQDDGSWPTVRRFTNYTVAVREGEAWRIKEVRTHVKPDTAAPAGTTAPASSAASR
jgi:uncharacterized protein (TIGR02246 family)